jgi:hypothetical protein
MLRINIGGKCSLRSKTMMRCFLTSSFDFVVVLFTHSCGVGFAHACGVGFAHACGVGFRLAAAAAAQLYPKAGLAVSGPTISGCTLAADGTSVTVAFNVTLLGAKGDKVQVGLMFTSQLLWGPPTDKF